MSKLVYGKNAFPLWVASSLRAEGHAVQHYVYTPQGREDIAHLSAVKKRTYRRKGHVNSHNFIK